MSRIGRSIKIENRLVVDRDWAGAAEGGAVRKGSDCLMGMGFSLG